MNWRIHVGAQADLRAALAYYRRHAGVSVAERFLAEFDRVADLLARQPGLGTPRSRGRRAFPMAVFPYSLVYSTRSEGILILVVRHQRQRPSLGESRQ